MNKYQNYSKLVVVFSVLGILLYDAFAFYAGGQEATISHVIVTDWIYNYPAAVFLTGFMCGHLFFPMSRKNEKGALLEK